MKQYAIFSHKTKRYQGFVSACGERRFEAARLRLARLVRWPAHMVSDADTIEYLARGHAATRAYVKAARKVRDDFRGTR